MDREEAGKLVRQAWLDYCRETDQPMSHSRGAPWEELTPWEQEVDRRIGEVLYAAGQAARRATDAAICEARADNRKYGPVGDRISDAVWNEAEACAVSIRAAKLPALVDGGT